MPLFNLLLDHYCSGGDEMKKRMLLVIINHENRPHISDALLETLSGVVISKKNKCEDWLNSFSRIYAYSDISITGVADLPITSFSDIESVIDNILSSPHTHYILDRRRTLSSLKRRDPFKNTFNYVPLLCECLMRSVDIINETEPDLVCFTSTPHDLESWTLFQMASAYNIPVAAVAESALPWRARVRRISPDSVYGYQEIAEEKSNTSWPRKALSEGVAKYIESKRGIYKTAEPQYMIKQKKEKKVRVISKVMDIVKGQTKFSLDGLIDYSYRALARRRLWKSYTQVMSTTLPERKFIAVFLHYQPERTSVPEGGAYASQWMVIQKLLAEMPPDWRLIVKEHPSTFLLDMTRPFRHPAFYDRLGRDPRITFVSPQTDSFEVIDRAEAVVTLTGRVGFEAICRGTPVVVFGDAAYKAAPGVIDWSGSRDVRAELETVISAAKDRLEHEGLDNYLSMVESTTVSEFDTKSAGMYEYGESISRGTMSRAVIMAAQLT